tara:strand:- start:158 stop:466 length:309 start_codon:yes stop_codon:yes gene_type:complete
MRLIDEINKEIKEMNEENKSGLNLNESTPPITKPKRKRGRPAIVENEIFVEMWTAALANGSLKEVAQALGISPASCSVKASNLRKAGVVLPQFKRGRRKKAE